MNCQEFEEIVVEAARGRSAEGGLPAGGLAHAETCADCAARLAGQRALSAGLRALAGSMAEQQAPGRVESALRSAFRGQTALPGRKPAGTRRWYGWAALAAACLILGVVTVGRVLSGPRAPQARPRPAVPAERPGRAVLAEARPAPAPPKLRRQEQSSRAAARRTVRRVRQPLGGEEQEAEFVPLLYGSAPTPLDGGQVVRLRLPPSALAALGLPVNMSRTEAVQADVLFAEDGMARAIRFLR
ncbi:MAG TPA: hypothetical protein VFA33_18655 [Bryobacteraceae bacterium]|nr:hypothetical protein [Bryobacteraceae bacterium]